MSFDSCIVTTSGCVVRMRCLSSSIFHGGSYAVCVELNFFYLFVFEVFCLFRVWECTGVGM